MVGDRFVSALIDVSEVFSKTVSKTSARLANVFHATSFADDDINQIAGCTSERIFQGEGA